MKKQEMIDYLKNHFRYDTMNSWNGSSSYAAKVKIRTFVPHHLIDTAYSALEVREAFDDINSILECFAINHDYKYQIGFNGRSSGYLVLYQGGYDKTTNKIHSFPGKSIDQGETFEEWSIEDLEERVKLIKEFDETIEDCKASFIEFCKTHNIVEKEIMVSKKIMIAEDKTNEA